MIDDNNSTKVVFDPTPEATRKLSPHEELMRQFENNNGPREPIPEGQSPPSDELLCEHVQEALRTIYDPEIPVNIYDLGLIYRVAVNDGFAEVDMTLTAPGCPVAQTFPGMVEASVKLVPGIKDAIVELVWEPPWRQELISEAARLELGLI